MEGYDVILEVKQKFHRKQATRLTLFADDTELSCKQTQNMQSTG